MNPVILSFLDRNGPRVTLVSVLSRHDGIGKEEGNVITRADVFISIHLLVLSLVRFQRLIKCYAKLQRARYNRTRDGWKASFVRTCRTDEALLGILLSCN